MDTARREKIAAILVEKKAVQPCSRCGTNKLEIVGETAIPLQETPGQLVLGGPSVPTVIVACVNCGNIWQHALGPLKLMPEAGS